MVVVCSLFYELHVFKRLLAAGCVHPKHVAGIFQTRSHVAVQNKCVCVCVRARVIKSECLCTLTVEHSLV